MHKLTGRSGSFQRPEPFDPSRRALRTKTLLPSSKLLAEEATASLQVLEHLLTELTTQLAPSGCLSLGRPGDDGNGLFFGATPNAYALDSGVDGRPLPVLIGGRILWLGGASTDGSDPFGFGAGNDRYSTVVLPAAPTTGSRDDAVFLEVWLEELDDQSTTWPWGCVQYQGLPLSNDILNTSYGATLYNKDLALRWRIRVVTAVDFSQDPWGLGAANVLAQAAAASPTGYLFTNMHAVDGDAGLWRAGDGSDAARADLGTTDGYSWALPLQRVHRRNQQAWSTGNPNGNSAALGDASDRPDGLFHDQVAPRDVLDLRYRVSLRGVDPRQILSAFTEGLYAGRVHDTMADSPLSAEVKGRQHLFAEAITATPLAGLDNRHAPDAVRRRFDDAPVTQHTVGFLTTGLDDADLGGRLSFVQSTSTVTLSVPAAPAGVLVGDATPVLRWVSTGADVALAGPWTGLGTGSASASLDGGDAAYEAAGEFCVEFKLDYPPHQGLRFLPETVHKADLNTTEEIYLTEDVAELTLANLTDNGAVGIVLDPAHRSITEIARRQTLAANANGVARAAGWVLDVSDGTPAGGLVEDLPPSQSVDVVYAYTPGTADQIRVFYDVVAPQTESLPDFLPIEIVYLSDVMQVSNLGTGGGSPGRPHAHPLLHIPEHAGAVRDSQLRNDLDLDPPGFSSDAGFLQVPVAFRDALAGLTLLQAPATDLEDRQAYTAGNIDLVCHAPALQTAQWHRTVLWGIARVTETTAQFLANELVALAFTRTADDPLNQAGVAPGVSCVGVYKLRWLIGGGDLATFGA